MQSLPRTLSALLLTAAALCIAGCSTSRLVDSNVQSFSSLSGPVEPSTYRFERLPSQQARATEQKQLEDLAEQALARVGLRRTDEAARFTVQIGSHTARELRYDPWTDPWLRGGYWGGPYGGWRGGYWGAGWLRPHPLYLPPPTLYLREASIVIRDAASGKVVYETRAVHEGVWPDDATLGAMFDAALRDFPQPLAGIRRVDVEIPR
ncbi:DUF4136 domain-containing protein [Xylophilus sp.]|uniref:DUF4136 domain-containing protein n=1 Tax=Xylophilus sp. TaxID=2653893 RepID=UPI0013BE58C4|nr:DUF4136 domain-containing protein [Xylophilus sp.]KAF1048371.1 MAG: hypothetical protein GAK38_01382 [Xylophilus sp.]